MFYQASLQRNFRLPIYARAMLTHFSQYTLVGAIGTVVHYATMAKLIEMMSMPVLSTTIGALLGALVNFILCRQWVFKDSASPARNGLFRFSLVALICALANAYVVGILYRLIGIWPAQLVATTATLIVGYMLNRFWTFRLTTKVISS